VISTIAPTTFLVGWGESFISPSANHLENEKSMRRENTIA
jgi:hypothetical protein